MVYAVLICILRHALVRNCFPPPSLSHGNQLPIPEGGKETRTGRSASSSVATSPTSAVPVLPTFSSPYAVMGPIVSPDSKRGSVEPLPVFSSLSDPHLLRHSGHVTSPSLSFRDATGCLNKPRMEKGLCDAAFSVSLEESVASRMSPVESL